MQGSIPNPNVGDPISMVFKPDLKLSINKKTNFTSPLLGVEDFGSSNTHLQPNLTPRLAYSFIHDKRFG